MCKHGKNWLKSLKWSVITYSNCVGMLDVVVLRALLEHTHTTDVWAILKSFLVFLKSAGRKMKGIWRGRLVVSGMNAQVGRREKGYK